MTGLCRYDLDPVFQFFLKDDDADHARVRRAWRDVKLHHLRESIGVMVISGAMVLLRNFRLNHFRRLFQRLLPAEVTHLRRDDFGIPSCTTLISVPHNTGFSVTVVCISPGSLGSSNTSV